MQNGEIPVKLSSGDHGRRLLVGGDRGNRTNLFSVDLRDGSLDEIFPTPSQHFHSNTRELIIGDGPVHRGGEDVLLWRFDGTTFSTPRILCRHRSSAHIQQLHVHPRLSPDGRQAVFTSDDSGYGSVYLVDLPEWENLPEKRL